MSRTVRLKLVFGVIAFCLLAAAYWFLHTSGTLNMFTDQSAIYDWVKRLGALGPLIIVFLMMVAILISPIPSAPIALAAGAAYGQGWGTFYVLVGAEAGALAAFAIARLVGHDAIHRRFGDRASVGLFGSQNALTLIVFVSRTLPFMSFDMVSYAAGLTVLKTWRFAIATLAGVAPISFVLAHFGSEMATGETRRIFVSVLALGGLTLIPVVIELVRERFAGRRRNDADAKPK
jgi:uncharacterized membrane protein YdjX (TVP38/TMEM64 family)